MSDFVLLFVCTGNICRSPMAEGIMKELILDEYEMGRPVSPMEVLSAGTHALDGNPASDYAVMVAGEHGIDLSGHRSRMVTEDLLDRADLVLTMEENHTRFIKCMTPGVEHVYELKRYGVDDEPPEGSVDVMDPIGMDRSVYAEVFDELEKEIRRVSRRIFELALEKHRSG